MPILEAIGLALSTIWAQKLKSFFTTLGVCTGVMFLIAVVSIVEGMGRYIEGNIVGKLMALNSFELRQFPNINNDEIDPETRRAYNRRPRILETDVQPVVDALPAGSRWAMYSNGNIQLESPFSRPRKANVVAMDGQYFE